MELDYAARWRFARNTKTGDMWRHRKTGKRVEVIGRVGIYGVRLLHESGRKTVKLDQYLASEYAPEKAG